MHGPARLDGRQPPGGEVQAAAAKHPSQPGGCAEGGHGEAARASGTAGQHGPGNRDTPPTGLDAAYCT